MRKDKILRYQNLVLKSLAHNIDDFYLAGGTALSLFYFQHRRSLDLDFFTKHFTYNRVKEIIKYLEKSLEVEIKLAGQSLGKDKVKMAVYNIYFNSKNALKIDFVEDVLDLIKLPKVVEGIKILSLEDIYLRKIYAIAGIIKIADEAGHKKFIGGRMDAKDFYDLYFLSHTFIALSDFVNKYCDTMIKEGLVRWFRTHDRMEMIDGILSLNTQKKTDYKKLEKYFKKEIDKIVESQLGEI